MNTNLAGILGAVGKGFSGYAEDRKQRVADVLQEREQQRADKQAQLVALLGQRTLRTPVLGDPTYAKSMGDVAGAEAGAAEPSKIRAAQAAATAAVSTHAADRDYDVAHPLSESPTLTVQPGQTGQPTVGVITHGRGIGTTMQLPDVGTKDTGPLGGSAAMNATRLSVAASQIQSANAGMTGFEDKLIHGSATISPEAVALARAAMSENPAISAGAEYTLTRAYPEVAEYVRNAKIVSSVERMVTPRGGSNSLMAAEAMLSGVGAGTGADRPQLIQQARDYRNGLASGLANHAQHAVPQSSAPPAVSAPAASQPHATGNKLTPEQYARAKQHYSDEEIRAAGYELP